jgi:hypothetical protein
MNQDSDDEQEKLSMSNVTWKTFKAKLMQILFVFSPTKPHLKEYYLGKMTSMYSRNFTIALWLTIGYKIVVELLFLIESKIYSYKMVARGIRLMMVFIYGALTIQRFLQKRINTVKNVLLLAILIEMLMTAGVISHYNFMYSRGDVIIRSPKQYADFIQDLRLNFGVHLLHVHQFHAASSERSLHDRRIYFGTACRCTFFEHLHHFVFRNFGTILDFQHLRCLRDEPY